MINQPITRSDAFFGRWVVRAAFTMAIFGWGVGFYGPPIFLHAVMERTGWSLSLVSAATTLHFVFGALAVANMPAVHKRIGIGKSAILGAVLSGVGVAGWALVTEPWQLFCAASLSGSGWTAMGAAGVNAAIAPWFSRDRPKALAFAYNGASLGGAVFSPLWVFLIGAFGFLAASVMVGSAMIIVISALALLVFSKTPVMLGQFPDNQEPREADLMKDLALRPSSHDRSIWMDRRFLTLTGGMATCLFAQIGLTAHLFSILVPALGVQQAGIVMGMATACAIAGRAIATSFISNGIDRRIVASSSCAVQLLGTVVLFFSGESLIWMIWLGVFLFGLGIGNGSSLPPTIAQKEFADADLSRVVALVIAFSQGTYAFGPLIFGLLLAMSPNTARIGETTDIFFIGAGLVQFLAISFFLAGRTRKGK